jgi:hypothetical protein
MLSETPEQLQEKMLMLYPDLGRQDALQQAAERAYQ